MNTTFIPSCLLAVALPILLGMQFIKKPLAAGPTVSTRIDSLMTAVYQRGQFSGAILVASHGKVLYEKAFGMANREKGLPFTPDTREYIGSVSKQFTAMGIMILHERGKIKYDQSIRDIYPELPACMQPVTIRDVVYHTSGLVIMDDFPNIVEQDVFKALLAQKELRFPPGQKFEYCNAGYSLLGMIIEKVSGQSLNDFMQANIFGPLGMHNSLVNEIAKPDTTRAVGYTEYGTEDNYDNYEGGNASILSTAADLYKWDQAIGNRLVSRKAWQYAFTPSSEITHNPALILKDDMFGNKSYGFGWWLAPVPAAVQAAGATPANPAYQGATNAQRATTPKDSWHDGAFGGYISYNERIPATGTIITVVSNLRARGIYAIRQAILNILAGEGYHLPPIEASSWLYQHTPTLGIDSAVNEVRFHLAADPDYDCAQSDINHYGYILLRAGRIPEAIKVFLLNTYLYPNAFNAYDSLADGYEKAGDKSAALESCRKALAIDPTSTYMQQRIAALGK